MGENNDDKISKLFSLIDIDNEGGIPKTKLKDILKKSIGDKFSEEEFEKLVEDMNVVDNDNISLMSFMTAMLNKENVANIPMDFDRLENVLRTVNKESDGQVGVKGWQNILTNLGINLSETEVTEVMNIACGIMKQVGGIDVSGLYGVDSAHGVAQTSLDDEAEMIDATSGEQEDVTVVEDKTSNETVSSESNQQEENK